MFKLIMKSLTYNRMNGAKALSRWMKTKIYIDDTPDGMFNVEIHGTESDVKEFKRLIRLPSRFETAIEEVSDATN